MELNEKLARWAGFTGYQTCGLDSEIVWCPPDQIPFDSTRSDYAFTSSLDACFKWLVTSPKINNAYVMTHNTSVGDKWVRHYMAKVKAPAAPFHVARAETPALALCKAIEQLIDKEGSDD